MVTIDIAVALIFGSWDLIRWKSGIQLSNAIVTYMSSINLFLFFVSSDKSFLLDLKLLVFNVMELMLTT
uniref:Uncharacterized protein n=1 Tax=Solanum tuberosum TaxID=4113 RepID=M1BIR7_SOLTU